MSGLVRVEVRVEGAVQGVGFRPFVYALAHRLGLAGLVGNDVHGVFVDLEGERVVIDTFLRMLESDAPPLARIERVRVVATEPHGVEGFVIVQSDPVGPPSALVTPDSATCADCVRELADPADRRCGYAFVNCTNCGPRFTIVHGVPYDRALTTMAGFTMCAECAGEYDDPADRRFHAQPTCCPECGPALRLIDAHGTPLPGKPLAAAAQMLKDGRIVAVKGLGGYHLAALAAHAPAVETLRRRKHRDDKPFAVMVPDLARAGQLCVVDEVAAALLSGPRSPIVLLPRRPDAPVAHHVAPGNRRLGLLLPYTPLHHLLLGAVAEPVVLTSGNVSDEPIAYEDDDALGRLLGVADAWLVHNRPINIRTDDSVVRPFRGKGTLLRRSRGYVPDPIPLPITARRPILACGAELKNTFCLAKEGRAFLSHHIGDLENYETLRSYIEGIAHFARLFAVEPEVVAYDLHPDYLSTKHAKDLPYVDLVGVQHHHAHIASCLADNGTTERVIGVAFDGLGYGTDGTFWGGEFLVADLLDFERAGHFLPVPMPGGRAAIRQPWRMAAVHLDVAYDGEPPEGLDVARRNHERWDDVRMIARKGVNAPLTSSAGRLFDAVAALIGLRDTITYEGQAAIELEQCADLREQGAYPATITPDLRIDGSDLVRHAAEDLLSGVAPPIIAARFHNGVVEVILRCCTALRGTSGLTTVALSGGVFQNLLLLERATDHLERAGFHVLTHAQVPCNDGGISLGQAAVAAAQDQR